MQRHQLNLLLSALSFEIFTHAIMIENYDSRYIKYTEVRFSHLKDAFSKINITNDTSIVPLYSHVIDLTKAQPTKKKVLRTIIVVPFKSNPTYINKFGFYIDQYS